MGGFSIRIEGLSELDAKLAELGGDAAKKVVNKSLRAGGEVFLKAVAEAAPERPELPSGTALPVGALAADIGMRIGRDDEGLPAAIVAPGKATAHVARWVEFGHRLVRGGRNSSRYRHGRFVGYQGAGSVVGNVPAHPFIRPAYEANVEPAVDAFVTALKEGIEAEAAK